MSAHEHTDRCDHTEVPSYAPAGLRWWARPWNDHGPDHDCCICGDTRKELGIQPLNRSMPVMVRPLERAS